MPIEFRCTQCEKLLRTGDDTAGKQAKCPECGTVMTIPMPDQGVVPPSQPQGSFEAAPSPFAAPPTPAAPESENPYQSPTGMVSEQMAFAPPGEIRPTRIEFGETLSRTWAVFTERWTTMLIGIIVAALVYVPVYGAFVGLQLAVVPNVQDQAVALAVNLLGQIAFQVFVLWLTIGVLRFALQVVRGEEARYGLVFSGAPYLLSIILCAILTNLIFVLGLVLLIIPGIIFMYMLWQAQLLIIDRNLGVIEAMSTSREVMVGNKLMVFALWFVAGILGYLFTIITCGLGALAFFPYMVIMHIVIYLGVTGQPTVADRYTMASEEPGGTPFGPTPGAPEDGTPFGPTPNGPSGDSPFSS